MSDMPAGSDQRGQSSGQRQQPSGREYFLRLEALFIELRGAPLLLSPSDWETARSWHADGIPLDVVTGALEEVFARRKENRGQGGIRRLRYFDAAVRKAWDRVLELDPSGGETPIEAIDVETRLRRLAAALPSAPAGIVDIRRQLLEARGGSEEVERALSALDSELLELAFHSLGREGRAEMELDVEKALDRLRDRLDESERNPLRRRLEQRHLRRHFGLPVLSLFAPEAAERGSGDMQ